MTGGSFSEWQAEYASFDLPSIVAEAATLNDVEPVNRLAGLFVRLVEVVCGEPALSPEDTLRAIRLGRALASDLRAAAPDDATRVRIEAAISATVGRMERFSAFPENAALIAIP